MRVKKYTYVGLLCACLLTVFVFAFSVNVKRTSAATKTEYAVALSEYVVENYDETVTVYGPNGETVQTSNGKFICKDLGTYSIVKNGKTVKTVNVIYKPFETIFSYASDFAQEVKTNEKVFFPVAQIYTEQESYESYTLRIEKEGELIEEFSPVKTAVEYAFTVSGEYTVVYSVVDSYGLTAKDTHTVNVLKSKEIVGVNISATTCVLNEIDFSGVEGLYEGKSYPVEIHIFNAENEEEALNNAKFLPVKTGNYKAVISCDFPDGEVVREIPFEVVLAEGSLFSNGTNVTGVTLNADTAKKKGLEISASGAGASIYYNKMIDLSEFTSDDKLISFYVPNNEHSDVHDIRVTLIDAKDENNQISVYWRRSKSAGWEHLTYCLVEFNGYAIALNNESATPTPREVYGAILACSFLRDNYSFNITYDKEENALYTWRSASLKIKLLDLDDADMLKGYRTWSGFSSDYVYMKIDFINNVKSTVQVESIGGINLKTSGNEIADENYLQFTYRGENVTGQKGEMLTGYVNQSYPLPVPVDNVAVFGGIETVLSLSVNTGAGFVQSADVVENYAFTPTLAGDYKATYGYYDLYGNYQTKTFEFTVKATNAPALNIYGTNVTADIMSYCKVPEITVAGGTGNVQKTVTYAYNGEAVEPNEDGLFFLDKKGSVEMKVTAKDELGVTAEMSFYVIVNNDVRLIAVDEIPLSYISGREYVLSDFTAIDYSLNEDENGYYMAKSVYVDGTLLGENRTFTCPTGVEYITVRYYGGEGTAKEVYKEIQITVVDSGAENVVSLDNLFQLPSSVSGELFEFGYALTFENDLSLNYANLLTTRELNLSVAVLQNAKAYTDIAFTLTDYVNEAQSLLIEFRNVTDKTVDLYVNGKFITVVKGIEGVYTMGNYKNVKYANYSFYLFDYKRMLVDDARNEICTIDAFASGKAYTGFDSGLVKLNLAVKGCEAQSKFVVNGFSNQNFTTYAIKNNADKTGPSIAIQSEFAKKYYQNDVLAVPKAIAYDVLQGKGFGVDLTVTKPDGSKTKLNGETINEITFTQLGTYKFEYVSYDYFGSSAKFEHTVIIKDTEKPQIVVNDEIPTDVKAGATLTLGNYTATDNVGITTKCVYVRTPQTLLLRVDGSYTFKETGAYSIIYFAKDAEGNDCTIVYQIMVS